MVGNADLSGGGYLCKYGTGGGFLCTCCTGGGFLCTYVTDGRFLCTCGGFLIADGGFTDGGFTDGGFLTDVVFLIAGGGFGCIGV